MLRNYKHKHKPNAFFLVFQRNQFQYFAASLFVSPSAKCIKSKNCYEQNWSIQIDNSMRTASNLIIPVSVTDRYTTSFLLTTIDSVSLLEIVLLPCFKLIYRRFQFCIFHKNQFPFNFQKFSPIFALFKATSESIIGSRFIMLSQHCFVHHTDSVSFSLEFKRIRTDTRDNESVN